MPSIGRSPSSNEFQPGDRGPEGLSRLGDVRVRVDLGRRKHMMWATQESKASARMREAFLEEAVWRDPAGAIHGAFFTRAAFVFEIVRSPPALGRVVYLHNCLNDGRHARWPL
jgi:hypothetical protein